MAAALKILFGLAFLVCQVPILVYLERRLSAFIQCRLGPNRVNLPLLGRLGGLLPGGLGQPLADAVKLMFKEDVIPAQADRVLYVVGPLLAFIPPAIGFAVIPFGNRIGEHSLQVANLNVGILFTMSVLSVAVYGLTFGGWASNNKYSLMGGLRASAQLISYEVTLGLCIVTALMFGQSVDPQKIVEHQTKGLLSWNIFGGGNLLLAPSGILATVLIFISALAENKRLPFDVEECDAELVSGFHTEYSSMKFALFFMGEYIGMIVMSSLLVTFFLGGWYFPGITDPASSSVVQGVLSVLVFAAKVMAVLVTYIWIRWTLPRFRYDQLMELGWKRMIPIALANLLAVAAIGVLAGGGR
jgi:NADH-quinone oxidoreductase subunit H